jgi:hypothetical protein
MFEMTNANECRRDAFSFAVCKAHIFDETFGVNSVFNAESSSRRHMRSR